MNSPRRKPGAGEELHRQPDERLGIGACGLEQLGSCAVVDDHGSRPILDRHVVGQDEPARWRVCGPGLGQVVEHRTQEDQLPIHGALAHRGIAPCASGT